MNSAATLIEMKSSAIVIQNGKQIRIENRVELIDNQHFSQLVRLEKKSNIPKPNGT